MLSTIHLACKCKVFYRNYKCIYTDYIQNLIQSFFLQQQWKPSTVIGTLSKWGNRVRDELLHVQNNAARNGIVWTWEQANLNPCHYDIQLICILEKCFIRSFIHNPEKNITISGWNELINVLATSTFPNFYWNVELP